MPEREKKPRDLTPEFKQIQEFQEFKVGGKVNWIDQKSKETFSRPALGALGEGPFQILGIRIKTTLKEGTQLKSYGDTVMLEIGSEKGKKWLSADFFKVAN